MEDSYLALVTSLVSQVGEAVAKAGTQRTEYLLRTRRYNGSFENAFRASMPQTRCTFIEKEFYLQPGINMRTEDGPEDHPESLRNPVLPDKTYTKIEQKPSE